MYVLGLYPDGDYFKVALLSKKGRKIKINVLNEYKKDILDLNKLKRTLVSETSYKDDEIEVVSALTPEEVFIRKINLPVTSRRAVKKALPFQIESIPFFADPKTNMIPVSKKMGKETQVTLFGYRDETIDTHIQNLKTLGFDPDWVSTVSHAFLRFSELFVSGAKRLLLFHFGWETSFFTQVKDGDVLKTVTIHRGLKHIIDAFKTDHRDLEEIDNVFIKEEIEKGLRGEIGGKNKEVLEDLKKQVMRAWTYLEQQDGGLEGYEGVVYTGYSDFSMHFTSCLGVEGMRPVDITPHLDFDRDQLCSYAIEIGLALDLLQSDEKTLQLRVGQYFSPKQKGRLRKKVSMYLGFACLSFVMAFATMKAYFIKKEDIAKHKFQRVVALGKESPGEYPKIQKIFISPTDFGDEVSRLLSKFRAQRKQGMFLTKPFLVSDFLDWLFSSFASDVEVNDLSYELIEYPHIENPRISYRIKFALSFHTENEESAETVKKRILNPPSGIVFDEEVSFKESEGNYEVVCFIKKDDKSL